MSRSQVWDGGQWVSMTGGSGEGGGSEPDDTYLRLDGANNNVAPNNWLRQADADLRYLQLSGGTMTGDINMGGQNILGVPIVRGVAGTGDLSLQHGGAGASPNNHRLNFLAGGHIQFFNGVGSETLRWDETQGDWIMRRDLDMVTNNILGVTELLSRTTGSFVLKDSAGISRLYTLGGSSINMYGPSGGAPVTAVTDGLFTANTILINQESNLGIFRARNVWIGPSTPTGTPVKGDLWFQHA